MSNGHRYQSRYKNPPSPGCTLASQFTSLLCYLIYVLEHHMLIHTMTPSILNALNSLLYLFCPYPAKTAVCKQL